MSDIDTETLHKIHARLYPNYLPGEEDTFIARTQTDTVLPVKQVCAAAARGHAVNSPEVVEACVNDHFDKASRQMCGGLAVRNKVCSVHSHPKPCGVYNRSWNRRSRSDGMSTSRFSPEPRSVP